MFGLIYLLWMHDSMSTMLIVSLTDISFASVVVVNETTLMVVWLTSSHQVHAY